MKAVLFFFLCLLWLFTHHREALSQVIIPFAYRNSKVISVTVASSTIYKNICSAGNTAYLYHGGKNLAPTSNATITFTGSGVSVFSDPTCTTPLTTATIFTYQQFTNFYVLSTTAGTTGTVTITSSQATGTVNTPTIVSFTTSATNPYTWTGGAGTNVWSTNGNWSGGVAPTAANVAYFDDSCTAFCNPTPSANVSVAGITIDSTFTGTITQPATRTITVGNRGWKQAGGTFIGSSSGDAITINGGFELTGGSFTSTSGTLTAGFTPWKVSGTGSFTHNSGLLRFTMNYAVMNITSAAATTYNNVTFDASGMSVNITGTMSVLGNYILNEGTIYSYGMNGGTIDVKGNVTVLGSGHYGSTLIKMSGSGAQTLDTSGAVTVGAIPSLEIASTGTVNLVGTITIASNYTFTSGTLSAGTSTMRFSTTYTTNYITFGASEVYNNMTFSSTGVVFNLGGSTGRVAGTLTLDGVSSSITNGTIEARGNVTGLQAGIASNNTGIIKLAGSSSQSFNMSGATGSGVSAYVPNITIASTGGTASFSGTINYPNNWIWQSGTVDMGTTTIKMYNQGASTFTPGSSVTYYNVTLYNLYNVVTSITTSLNVSNNLLISTTSSLHNVNMPNPGIGYSITVGGTLTVQTGCTLNLYGATKTHGTLVNSGTINP